jgi:2,4-dienoyl-CoA reductase-like NADH-dependent reductase (Old Yellow Enzyme family)
MKKIPELIVMLTHNDKTVADAIEVFEASKDTPAEYWGFKEVGLEQDKMKKLVEMMKQAGKTTFLEVVEYTEDECIAGAKIGVECGFDILMGTMYFDSVRDIAKQAGMKYMPFVGEITGRPSILGGTIDGMIEEANSLIEKGIDGIDLLAYRFTGDPEELAARFVEEVDLPVCLAGSIKSFERLDKMKEIAPWTYTIGSAFFDKKFGDMSFADQINVVCDYMKK